MVERRKTLQFAILPLLLVSLLIHSVEAHSLHQCVARIERAGDDSSDGISLDSMALEVLQTGSNKVVESFPCTPDGNCFALVQDLPEFALRITGHKSALFEPKLIKIGGQGGRESCEDLAFVLKGYVCNVPVKLRTAEGDLVPGPAGISIKLKQNTANGRERFAQTDENGVASFEDVPDAKYNAYFDGGETVAPDGGKTLYWLSERLLQVEFSQEHGFTLSKSDGFVIESTLVEGFIKQQLSDTAPAKFIKVVAKSADDSESKVI